MSKTFNITKNQLLLGTLLFGLMTNSHALSIVIEEVCSLEEGYELPEKITI